MKIKNVLCVAALSAAVALSGVPAGGVAQVVQAEENQFSGLDEILKEMYAYYVNGDYASMSVLDNSEAANAYFELIRNSGTDRYVIDLDGNTKAMMYVSPSGYWWYFGQMENNLRQGNGTTIVFGWDNTEIFTGSYAGDFPNGVGKWSKNYSGGGMYNIPGNFQGALLNGTYQVDVNWTSDGISYASSLPITYVNNHMQSVDGWNFDVEYYDTGEGTDRWYYFSNDKADVYFPVDYGYELYAVGLSADMGGTGHCFFVSEGEADSGYSIFMGNTDTSASVQTPTPAPTVTTPTPAPTVTTPTPAPTVTITSGTYTVERGDNLSNIAQKVYGDRKLWRKIYKANSNVIKSDYVIWANQVLIIPEL